MREIGEPAQAVKVPAANLQDLSLIPRTHIVGRES